MLFFGNGSLLFFVGEFRMSESLCECVDYESVSLFEFQIMLLLLLLMTLILVENIANDCFRGKSVKMGKCNEK